MSRSRNSRLNKADSALQETVRLSDPLRRMRRERRIALLLFNGLLLAAALMHLLGRGVVGTETTVPAEAAPPPIMEFFE